MLHKVIQRHRLVGTHHSCRTVQKYATYFCHTCRQLYNRLCIELYVVFRQFSGHVFYDFFIDAAILHSVFFALLVHTCKYFLEGFYFQMLDTQGVARDSCKRFLRHVEKNQLNMLWNNPFDRHALEMMYAFIDDLLADRVDVTFNVFFDSGRVFEEKLDVEIHFTDWSIFFQQKFRGIIFFLVFFVVL